MVVTAAPAREVASSGGKEVGASGGSVAQRGEETAAAALLVVEVRVNGAPSGMVRAARRPGGPALFSGDDLRAWRVRLPGGPATVIDGVPYYDLTPVAGATVEFDELAQASELHLPAEAFVDSAASAADSAAPPLTPSVFGTWLNYDLAVQKDGKGQSAAALVEAAASGEWGMASTSALVGSATGAADGHTVRLESTLRRDDPQRFTRLTVGDTIQQGAAWSTPFRFGGVQFGTQFRLRPGFVSYPTPTLQGGAALPSAVELYVNDTLRYQGRVDRGPFTLDQVPVLTGAGEMRFNVTDALGVTRTVLTPYYVSSSLLKAGLTDYSVDIGWTRLGYGTRSFDYGPPFAAGNWRRGLSDSMTAELHGEASTQTQAAGAGATWVWPSLGEFGLHAALSRSTRSGSGHLVRATYARLGPDWSFSASRQIASAGFSQVATEDEPARLRSQTQVFAGHTLGRLGNLGASFTEVRREGSERVRVLTASHSVSLGSRAVLTSYIARSQSSRQSATQIGFSLTIPLGERESTSVSVQRQSGRATVQAEVTRAAPPDEGWGYRLAAAGGEFGRTQAQALWRTGATELGAEVASDHGRGAARLTARGSVGLAGGIGFAAQQASEAFAIVTVDGAAPGLDIYRDNQPVARTDAAGRAVIGGLRPYEVNRLSIDSTRLSIDTQLRGDKLTVVPRQGGFAVAAFEVSNVRSATLTALQANGQ
ncbi:MAG: fimbria/pilus outer membrane usher protein, partial [Gammaproteobacteria bacterium]|nr:fimbria/pilus outer membrane usher protein [Gammaproteobacteria bacterium]